jgi:hypothetical protein
MTDEKEDKRDFISKMNNVQKAFFYIAITVGSGIFGFVGVLIIINIRKNMQVNAIKQNPGFKDCGQLEQLAFKFKDTPKNCSCYSAKDANSIYGCVNNIGEMFNSKGKMT